MTDRPAPEVLLALSSAHVAARALHVVAELGVADRVPPDGARSAEELGADLGARPDGLHRLLRLLESHGVFTAAPDGRWRHTETSRWLREDHPRSLRAFARMLGMPFGWEPFTALASALSTGEPSVRVLDPAGPWAYLAGHPDEEAVFQEAMLAKAHDDVAAVLQVYDFSAHRCVADIGGGGGHLVTAVLAAHEGPSGVLFDLPHVVATVRPAPRLAVVGGDFFADPLPESDCYVLMNVIHDWEDKEAGLILSAVGDAAAPGATVLVVETVLPEGPEPHWAKTLDVLMLALTGGRERTAGQYRALLGSAGMEVTGILPTRTPFAVIEARLR